MVSFTPAGLPAQETPYNVLFDWKRAAETGDLETFDSLYLFTQRYVSFEPRIPSRWFRTWRYLVEGKLIHHVDINSMVPYFPKEDPDTMTFSGIRLRLGQPESNWFLETRLTLNRVEGKWTIVRQEAQAHPFTKDDSLFQKYYTESPQYQQLQNHPTGKEVFLFLCNFLEEWRTEQINGKWDRFLSRYHDMSKILLEKTKVADRVFFQFIDRDQLEGGLDIRGLGEADVLLGIDYTTLRVNIVGDAKIKVQTMLVSFDLAELEFSPDPVALQGKVVKNRMEELAMIRGEPYLFVIIREIRDRGLEWDVRKIKKKIREEKPVPTPTKIREESE
jgi:hypothetical protein